MLDADYIHRAAPLGSMRYFALLYAPPEQRDAFAALFAIDTEIRTSALAAHEVAHTRLQWWRAEVDRLVNRNAQHPVTQLLQAALPDADFARLHELLVAADMDLTRMTYNTAQELNAYLDRSGGCYDLVAPQADPTIRRAGAVIRRVETLRDLAIDLRAGRVYWPLDELDQHSVAVEQLRGAQATDAVRSLIASEVARIQSEIRTLQLSMRPLRVLLDLHGRLLHRIERANYDVVSRRLELRPIEKIWTAWRAARRS